MVAGSGDSDSEAEDDGDDKTAIIGYGRRWVSSYTTGECRSARVRNKAAFPSPGTASGCEGGPGVVARPAARPTGWLCFQRILTRLATPEFWRGFGTSMGACWAVSCLAAESRGGSISGRVLTFPHRFIALLITCPAGPGLCCLSLRSACRSALLPPLCHDCFHDRLLPRSRSD